MRKSILSAYLMGAIALATASTFVSCKDYDDDITNLQEQITNADALHATKVELQNAVDKWNEELATTEKTLKGLIEEAKGAADKAQAAADKAQATADQAVKDAAAAQKAADDEAARAKDEEDRIYQRILTLEGRATDLETEITMAKEAIQKLDDLKADKKDLEAFENEVKETYATIKALDDKFGEAMEKSEELVKALEGRLENEVIAVMATKADLKQQQDALNKLAERVTKLEGELPGMKEEIAAIQNKIKDINSEIEKIKKDIADNAKSIEEIKDELKVLDARLTTAQTTADTALQAANKALEAAAANKLAIENEAKRAKEAEAEAKAAAQAAQKTADQAVKDAANAQKTADQAVKDAANAKAAADKAQAAADKAQATADKNAKDLADEAARAKAAEAKAQAAAEKAQAAADKAQATANQAVKDAAAAQKAADDEAARAKKVEAELQGKLDEANAAIEKAQKAADDAQAAADKAQESADAAQTAADKAQATADQAIAEINVLTVYVHHALRSLVLDPDEYYWGVEAVNIKAYAYNVVTVDAADVNKDQVIGEDKQGDHKKVSDKEVTGKNAFFEANYFLNPSGANVSENAADYNFVNVKDANYTRVAACGDLKVVNVKKGTGKVNVQGTVQNPELIKEILLNNQVTVFALQYNVEDSVITSDFAALRRSWVKGFKLNKVEKEGDVDKETAHHHLYKTAAEAANATPLFSITYDGKDSKDGKTPGSIDLNKWINVHANLDNNAFGWDALWGGQETVNKAGFEIQYELIGYTTTNGKESTYATINGSTLKAQNPAGGDPVVEMIGHTPLVRAKLVYKNDNNTIVEVRYFKVAIVGQSSNVNIDLDVDVKVACGDEIVIDTCVLTDQVVKDSLMSVEAFKKFRLVEVQGVATQFNKDNKTWGVVSYATHAGKYLNLKVKNGEAYAAFSKNVNKSVTVKYTNEELGQDIFVTINLKNKNLLTIPALNITDADKTATPWFATNSTEKGFDEVHAHVNEGTLGASMWVFGLDKALWKKDGITETLYNVLSAKQEKDAVLKNLEDITLTYKFVKPTVTEVKCATLRDSKGEPIVATLEVSEDGTKLYAKSSVFQKTVIATLNPENGEIEYMQNDPAGEVLNWAAHNELNNGETLTARVGVSAKVCDPIGDLTINGGEFDVKFLRPISFSNEHAEVIDAIPAVYDVEVLLNFTDWRDWTPEQFAEGTKGKDFAEFYELKSIKMNDKAPVMTDFAESGKFVAMNEALETYFEFSMDEVSPIVIDEDYKAHVVVKYIKHAGEVVSQFQAKIPVILEYAWGKLSSEIIVTVKPTEANAVRARK